MDEGKANEGINTAPTAVESRSGPGLDGPRPAAVVGVLTREEILAADDLPTRRVIVPEWSGREVIVRGLDARGRVDFEMAAVNVRRGGAKPEVEVRSENLMARLVVLCVVNERGERVFRDEDVELLGRKSGEAVARLFAVAQELSGLGGRDEGEKNLG